MGLDNLIVDLHSDSACNLGDIEAELASKGFSELYGVGLWGKDKGGPVVDTNSGFAVLAPSINASSDNFYGVASTVEKLNELLDKYTS